jgi:MerR family transcriptional regulator, light-induced transcriptional regulator
MWAAAFEASRFTRQAAKISMMRNDTDDADSIDLTEAARVLGVHYQTAYGWVRNGALPAVKVGKTYRVRRTDLDRFATRRNNGRPPKRIQVRDWGHQIDRLAAALDAGDERAARDVIDRLAEGRMSPVELCDELLAPVLRRIGDQWAAGIATVADEHRASAICERLLARFPTRRTRVRGTAVVTTPAGEHHRLPALMAAIALRWHGWRVHHLASDIPASDLAAFLERERPDLLVLSVTVADGTATQAAQQAAKPHGVPVLIGRAGQRLSDLLAAALPLTNAKET